MAPRRHPPNPVHAARRAIERVIMAKLASGEPLASAPPDARSIIATSVRMEFADRRFTFMQLIKHAFTIPELAWWITDPRGFVFTRLVDTVLGCPADDARLYSPRRALTSTQEEASEMAVDAVLQSGLWTHEIKVFETDNEPHLVFVPATLGSR